MADESKLKAQAREFLDAQPANPCMTTDDEVELFAAFAHEQVKAETADLRAVIDLTDEFVTKDWMISKKGDLVALRIFDDGEVGNYLHFDTVLEAFAALTKLQENK